MFNLDQNSPRALGYERPFAIRVGGLPMFTSDECRARAEDKLAQAERDHRHRKRLITAAEAWLLVASQLRRVEATLVPKTRTRRTTAWWIEPT
jgi:hypothetical protein